MGRSFDTVVDSGCFHVFDDADRQRYVHQLRAACTNRLFILGFSHLESGERGPGRMFPAEFEADFQTGWRVVNVSHHRYESMAHHGGAQPLVAHIVRVS